MVIKNKSFLLYFALAISIALVAYLVLAGFSSSMLGTTGFVTGNVSSGQNISGDFVINVTYIDGLYGSNITIYKYCHIQASEGSVRCHSKP